MIIVAASPSVDFTAAPNREPERRAAKEKANQQQRELAGSLHIREPLHLCRDSLTPSGDEDADLSAVTWSFATLITCLDRKETPMNSEERFKFGLELLRRMVARKLVR
jgi:hypothetical protein